MKKVDGLGSGRGDGPLDDPFLLEIQSAAKEREDAIAEANGSALPRDHRVRDLLLEAMGSPSGGAGDAAPTVAEVDPRATNTSAAPTRWWARPPARTMLAAAALGLVSTAGWFTLTARGTKPAPEAAPGGADVRMGPGAGQVSTPVRIVSRRGRSVSLDLGSGSLGNGWYQASASLAEDQPPFAVTPAWQMEPEWTVELPQDQATQPGSLWLTLRVLMDDGTDAGLEASSWRGQIFIDG